MIGGRYPYLIPFSWVDTAAKRAADLVPSRAHQCAFRLGYLAKLTGKRRRENPYQKDAGWRYHWCLGWDTSESENETVTFSAG